MSDRRPEIELTVQDRDENNNLTGDWRYVSDAEVVEYVRRQVESGTIKGEVRQTDNRGESVWMSERPFAPGTYIVIGPIADEEDA